MFPSIIVLDTGVLVSYLLNNSSPPGQVASLSLARSTVLVSEYLLNELTDVLWRPKFSAYIHPGRIDAFLSHLQEIGIRFEPTDIPARCRDPKDDPILALAIAGKADVLISGDQDLLCLDPLEKLRLLSPRQFLDLYAPKAD